MSLLERANLLLCVYAGFFPEPSCYPQSATHQFELGTVNRSLSLCIRQWCSFSGPKCQSKPAGECLQVSYVVLEISRFLQKVFQSICIRFQCWIVLKPPNSLRENASNSILKCLSWLPPLHWAWAQIIEWFCHDWTGFSSEETYLKRCFPKAYLHQCTLQNLWPA